MLSTTWLLRPGHAVARFILLRLPTRRSFLKDDCYSLCLVWSDSRTFTLEMRGLIVKLIRGVYHRLNFIATYHLPRGIHSSEDFKRVCVRFMT